MSFLDPIPAVSCHHSLCICVCYYANCITLPAIDDLQILSLHGIGQVRAMRIVTARNAGHTFVSLEDLEEVGMNEKTVARFLKSNAAAIVS